MEKSEARLKKYRIPFRVQVALFLAGATVLVSSYVIVKKVSLHFNDAVQQIPKTVKDIKIHDSSTMSDVLYVIKAKMTYEEFQEYIQNLNCELLSNSRKETVDWLTHISGLTWWDPAMDKETTYYDPRYKGSYCVLVKYENGYAYYIKSSLISWW